mmetsp:Transcript_26799/g.62588  ORF Transcript_26799/g.62588 Transcript_26799/m.62588 type:complete len:228 (+) Transcript_26799:1004-1687(+)
MLQRVFRRDALRRFVLQQCLQQMNSMLAQFHPSFVVEVLVVPHQVAWDAYAVVLGQILLVLRQINHGRPGRLGWRTKHLEDAQQLVVIRSARKQRVPTRHLPEDAANAPEIHRSGILPRSHEDVGRAIPQRHHLVGVAAHRNAKSPRQTEIRQFELTRLVDQQILRLQISVQHTPVMAELDPSQQLVERRLNYAGLEVLRRIHKLLQVLIKILEHKRQLLLRVDNVV